MKQILDCSLISLYLFVTYNVRYLSYFYDKIRRRRTVHVLGSANFAVYYDAQTYDVYRFFLIHKRRTDCNEFKIRFHNDIQRYKIFTNSTRLSVIMANKNTSITKGLRMIFKSILFSCRLFFFAFKQRSDHL